MENNKETPQQMAHRQAREREYQARVNFMKDLANKATMSSAEYNFMDPLSPNFMGLVPTHTKISTTPTPSPGY